MRTINNTVRISRNRLKRIPEIFSGIRVIGDFSCSHNRLTSLEGAPASVEGDFSCSYNQLTSLEGAPASVGGNFFCSYNQLTSLEGAPASVGGNFFCSNNSAKFTEAQVRAVSNVKGGIYV